MTLALVLLIVEVLAPSARRLFARWMADEHRHAQKPGTGFSRPPDGD